MKTAEIERPKLMGQSPAGCRMETFESESVRKVQQSISYMLRHLDQSLQVATLAARANVSPSHFFALFKRQIGCAPIDYFIRLRMQHACRLLDETGLSVKEVAAALGYDDPFYFSRIFKSVNRVAPSEYRLSRNGAKEAVKDGGVDAHRFQTSESSTDFGRTESHLTPYPAGLKSRMASSPSAVLV
jgi:transcriptional regulator GlxA family with amidase domain